MPSESAGTDGRKPRTRAQRQANGWTICERAGPDRPCRSGSHGRIPRLPRLGQTGFLLCRHSASLFRFPLGTHGQNQTREPTCRFYDRYRSPILGDNHAPTKGKPQNSEHSWGNWQPFKETFSATLGLSDRGATPDPSVSVYT